MPDVPDPTDPSGAADPATGGSTVVVRYFAGAAAAARLTEEKVTVPDGATVADLSGLIAERHGPALARVLAAASFLLDEVAGDTRRVLRDGAHVDVLPPFAGG